MYPNLVMEVWNQTRSAIDNLIEGLIVYGEFYLRWLHFFCKLAIPFYNIKIIEKIHS
jgi:hypothetical protein